MTKSLLRKQIIVSIDNNNKAKFITSSSKHITNLNRILKNIKLDVIADFTCMNQIGIVIVTNKVASLSDLQIIENYVMNIEYINSEDVEIPYLP